MHLETKKGFTLIELLVVVAIIGILASVVLANLNSGRDKARDVRRKTDLGEIRTALELYYSVCGTYIVKQNCNGSAYGTGGDGFFNYAYTATGSVAKGLVDNGVAGGQIIDPSGAVSGANSYMIYVNQNYYTVWASLANPSTTDTATLGTCYFSVYDNYSGAGTQNYCLSN